VVVLDFKLTESLKNHYFFDYSIEMLIEAFELLFKHEREKLLDQFEKGSDRLHGELSFSMTLSNMSNMIVYKYFNDPLTFAQKAFVTCSRFEKYPFLENIKRVKKNTKSYTCSENV
jgi:hypothetical protein